MTHLSSTPPLFKPYREDNIFSFSTMQHANLSLALEHIMERIHSKETSLVSKEENIFSKPVFNERYQRFYQSVTKNVSFFCT